MANVLFFEHNLLWCRGRLVTQMFGESEPTLHRCRNPCKPGRAALRLGGPGHMTPPSGRYTWAPQGAELWIWKRNCQSKKKTLEIQADQLQCESYLRCAPVMCLSQAHTASWCRPPASDAVGSTSVDRLSPDPSHCPPSYNVWIST